MSKKLGRGLSALIPDYSAADVEVNSSTNLRDISLTKIVINPFQPRKVFKEDSISELASSIMANGLIQPIVVRKKDTDNYELISGERRFRAVKKLGYDSIPAIIKNDVSDNNSMLMALIENIQREDISALEQAEAYEKIISIHNLTQQQLSEMVGKNRSTITNTLRLLELGDEAKKHLAEGNISEGHARVLLQYKEVNKQAEVLLKIINKGLSVREAELLTTKKPALRKPSKMLSLNNSRFQTFYTNKNGKGKFIVRFDNEAQFKELQRFLENA